MERLSWKNKEKLKNYAVLEQRLAKVKEHLSTWNGSHQTSMVVLTGLREYLGITKLTLPKERPWGTKAPQ